MKTLFVALGLLLGMVPAHAKDELPDLFAKKPFHAATLAEAANYYISLGEKRAIEELKALEERHTAAIGSEVDASERIGWICRMIFKGKGDKPLRPPGYGGLWLPYLTMPLERWPLYPIAESEGVFFVLSEGYRLSGVAERASDYIDYCSSNASFRLDEVKIPTRSEAIAAFNILKDSERWKVIKWKDEGPGSKYTMREEWVLRDIKTQATGIPENQVEAGAHDVKLEE